MDLAVSVCLCRNASNFGQVICVYALCLWAFESVAQLFAVTTASPLLGMLNFVNVWFASFLFSGIMVPEDDVIWPFRIFCSILPLKWSLQVGISCCYFTLNTYLIHLHWLADDVCSPSFTWSLVITPTRVLS